MIPPFSRLPLLAAALAVAGCSHQTGPKQEKAAAGPPPTVRVTAAQLQDWPRVVRVQGSLAGDEEAVVGANVAGLVQEVPVDLGTVVRKGDVLAALRTEEFDVGVRQAEAQLGQVRSKLGLKPGEPDDKLDPLKAPTVRQEKAMMEDARTKAERGRVLLGQKVISPEEAQLLDAQLAVAAARYESALNGVDEQVALLAAQKAALQIAKQARSDAVIRAPFDGVVALRHVAPGAYVVRGAAVVTVVRADPLRFRAAAPERDALRVQIGQPLRIVVEGSSEPITATVTRVSPALDLASRALTFEADVPNRGGRLRAGLFAEAEVVVDPKARALTVPATAVTEFAGVEKVWLVKDGEAKEQRVRTGRREIDRVEVVVGLSPGDPVAADARQARAGRVVAQTDATGNAADAD